MTPVILATLIILISLSSYVDIIDTPANWTLERRICVLSPEMTYYVSGGTLNATHSFIALAFSACEMTCIVSSGALNSTHSLTHSLTLGFSGSSIVSHLCGEELLDAVDSTIFCRSPSMTCRGEVFPSHLH